MYSKEYIQKLSESILIRDTCHYRGAHPSSPKSRIIIISAFIWISPLTKYILIHFKRFHFVSSFLAVLNNHIHACNRRNALTKSRERG